MLKKKYAFVIVLLGCCLVGVTCAMDTATIEPWFKDKKLLEFIISHFSECRQGEDQKLYLELCRFEATQRGNSELFKYVTECIVALVNDMTVDQRIKYNFNYYDRDTMFYVEDKHALLSETYEACTGDFGAWIFIFNRYHVLTRWFSTRYIPDRDAQWMQAYKKLESIEIIQEVGRKPDFEQLDAASKSLFNGTYYDNALNDVCRWYKDSDENDKKIIKECAHICGHTDIFKALRMLDSHPMQYVLSRSLGKK
jgi:hypothetical protein